MKLQAMSGSSSSRRLVRYFLAIVAALLLAWGFMTVRRYNNTDDCLDRGGAWNEKLSKCEM